jgi:hypothetical protein
MVSKNLRYDAGKSFHFVRLWAIVCAKGAAEKSRDLVAWQPSGAHC